MYRANVVNVMIATPSDVVAARGVARQLIYDWNTVHSEASRTVLLPLGWDSHSYPSMQNRPQALINEQVLTRCDLLVAVFWTRIGTPTGEAPSGTVEEIREHLAAEKHAMLYFSNEPVHPASVDEEQYRAVRDFRKECEQLGLVESFETMAEFREKFARQLASMIRDHFADLGADEEHATRDLLLQAIQGGGVHEASLEEGLPDAAKELLVAAAADSDGTILRTESGMGIQIGTNSREFVEQGSARSEARWDAALRTLIEADLERDRGYRGEVFMVTDKGYAVADRLRG